MPTSLFRDPAGLVAFDRPTLEAIVAEPGKAPLLEAIGDGTFGLMKRPADKGKGLDGVVRTAAGYYNPATDVLENDPAPLAARGGAR